jgi:hypothetical protein
MTDKTLAAVRAAVAQSDLLRAVASVRADRGVRLALGNDRPRPLLAAETARLEQLGNEADDWARVKVADGFNPERVRGCRFHGDVVLGRFTGSVRLAGQLELPAGLRDSTLANCVIGHGCLVHHVRLLANYVVGPGAVLSDCGTIACEQETSFGVGMALRLGPETGGREVPIYAEIDVATAAAVARPSHRDLRPHYQVAVADYRRRALSAVGIIERGARLRAVPILRNSYVGSFAEVDGATLLADVTLLSSAEAPVRVQAGACVSNAVLQWGSTVTTFAVVQRAVLMEQAAAEHHAKVTESVLGPNTAASAGEIASCLLGPFVGCHHQSLLIATLWPQGRGNLAYGANVGCNHTSRAPDQECWIGEGMFFGLGVNVKFPADFSQSPYSVVACGLTLLPQRLAFPFSLLTAPSSHPAGVSTAFAEIIPAWMLAENWFALERSEAKLRARDRAVHSRIDYAVFRPEIIDLVRDACCRLEAVRERREVYTEQQIPGLGKNFLREACRQRAVAAYRFALQLYALLGLKERLEAAFARGEALGGVLEAPGGGPRWQHQLDLLREELKVDDVRAVLAQLPPLLERLFQAVESSRGRDDERGARILAGYADAHPLAGQDDVVRGVRLKTARLQAEVAKLLAVLRAQADSVPTPRGVPSASEVDFYGSPA